MNSLKSIKHLRYCLIALYLVFAAGTSYGQSQFDVHTTLPPAPTISNFVTGADINLNSFTGVPSIVVPLLKYQNKDLSLPVSLSYNASGIKVASFASNTGLGWNLDFGGVITRTVRGYPDDEAFERRNVGGYLWYNAVSRNFDSNPNPAFQDDYSRLWDIDGDEVIGSPQHGPVMDTEPDIFNFNFMGVSGQFFLNSEATTVSMVPVQNLKISFKIDPGYKTIIEFDVIDSNGDTYVFADLEKNISNFVTHADYLYPYNFYPGWSPNQSASSQLSRDYIAAWYLSKIITHTGQVINFTYDTETYSYGERYTTSVRHFTDSTKVDNGEGFPILNGCEMSETRPNDLFYSYKFSYDRTEDQVESKRIKTIEGEDFKITIDPGGNRVDLNNTKSIADIKYYKKYLDNNATLQYDIIKTWNFYYSYFQSSTSDNHNGVFFSAYNNNNDPSGNSRFQRLRLDSLCEISSTNIRNPAFVFDYNYDIPLPNTMSLKQDFFGYFNNNDCASMIPKLYVYPNKATQYQYSVYPISTGPYDISFVMPGADRTVNASAIVSGTISKIHYPTGGSTQFTFEPKEFYYAGQNRLGGGLRLRQRLDYDGINNNNNLIKNYTYKTTPDNTKSSGVIFEMPQFAYVEHFMNYSVWGGNPLYDPVPSNPYTIQQYNFYEYNLQRLDNPEKCVSSYNGIDIGYSEIKEETPGNGFIVRRYSTPAPYGNFRVTDDDDNADFCNVNEQGFCDVNLFVAPRVEAALPIPWINSSNYLGGVPASLYQEGLYYDNFFTFPFAPSMNYDWNRGLLLSEKTFDNNGLIKSQVKNTYQLFTPSTPTIKYGVKHTKMLNWNLIFARNYNGFPQLRPDFYAYARYPMISNIDKVLTERDDIVYNGSDSIKTVTQLIYNNNKDIAEQRTIESDGKEKKVINRYAYDFPSDPASADLISNNRGATLQQQTVQVSGQDIKASKIQYKNWGNNKYGVPTIEPETVNDIYRGTTNVTQKRFLSYDMKGNPKDYLDKESLPVVSLWGYNRNFIVAQATNTTNSQIAFTSFEENINKNDPQNPYNWDVTSTIINTDAKTGNYSCLVGQDRISSTNVLPIGSYNVTYWEKSGVAVILGGTVISTSIGSTDIHGWRFVKNIVQLSTPGHIDVLGYNVPNLLIDELRLYPVNASLTTFTYDPLIGITSVDDSKGIINYYQYDGSHRLAFIKDQFGNTVKKFCYNYAGQSAGCPIVTEPVQQNPPTPEPNGIYARVEIDNVVNDIGGSGNDSHDYESGDVYIRLYLDAACTIPLTATSNLTFLFRDTENYNDDLVGQGSDVYESWVTIPTGSNSYYIGFYDVHLYSTYTDQYYNPHYGYWDYDYTLGLGSTIYTVKPTVIN